VFKIYLWNEEKNDTGSVVPTDLTLAIKISLQEEQESFVVKQIRV
jgi:hypothetical protein